MRLRRLAGVADDARPEGIQLWLAPAGRHLVLTPDEIEHAFRTTPQAIEYHTTTEVTAHVEGRSTGPPSLQILGDGIKPVAFVKHPDGTSDVLFAFYPRSTRAFVCVAVPKESLSRGKATAKLRKGDWWCAVDNADKHLNAMVGDVRDVLPTIHRAPHQGLQDDDTFLLNGTVIGANAHNWRLDPKDYIENQRAGTLQGWQAWSARAVDYSLVLVSTAAGLATLPKIALRHPGFGICIVGKNSTGKSTLTRLNRSVIGDPDKLEDWNTSRAGLEGRLLALSHTPITPDEIRSGVDIQRDETITHLIGNERLRTLAPGYPGGQRVQIIIFTNKEMKQGDPRLQKPNQGDDARWINIAIPEGKQGVLIGAHKDDDTGAIMKGFIEDARTHHGWAYEDFARRLLEQRDWRSLCADAFQVAEQAIGGHGLTPLEERGRRIFSLIGATGFLSAALGTTTWDCRAALDAAAECFDFWRNPPIKLASVSHATAIGDDLKALSALRALGVGTAAHPAVATVPLEEKIKALLGAEAWMSLDDLRLNGVEPNAESPPFLHQKDGESLVCAGSAYLTNKLGENPAPGLRRLKERGSLVTNASGGLKWTINTGPLHGYQQFVAIPTSLVPWKVEVEGSFNP